MAATALPSSVSSLQWGLLFYTAWGLSTRVLGGIQGSKGDESWGLSLKTNSF